MPLKALSLPVTFGRPNAPGAGFETWFSYFVQVEVRITAPLQWGSLPEEAAGFHVVRRRTPRVESPASHAEHSDNLQVHIHNEEVLEALENMRRVRSAEDPPEFRIRHRVRYHSFGPYCLLRNLMT